MDLVKFENKCVYGTTSGTGIGYDRFEFEQYIMVHKRTDKNVWVSTCRVNTVVCGRPCGPTPIDYVVDALSVGEIVRRKIYVGSDGVEYIRVDDCRVSADDVAA